MEKTINCNVYELVPNDGSCQECAFKGMHCTDFIDDYCMDDSIWKLKPQQEQEATNGK